MDTRNLDRVININKVLFQHCKVSGNRIELMELSVLMSVYHLSPATIISIVRRLKYVKRTMSANQVQDVLKDLMLLGYVERINKKYVLTLSGKNLVFELETRLRKSRNDR